MTKVLKTTLLFSLDKKKVTKKIKAADNSGAYLMGYFTPNRRQAINAFRYFLENDLHFGGCEAKDFSKHYCLRRTKDDEL
jgi:hypothetical protein